jgi:hypothetical protein
VIKVRCRRCEFEGTWDEVDDHFVERIESGDLVHVRMPGRTPDLPADFSGQRSQLGECFHNNAEQIRPAYVTYCRDCHDLADSPVPPECTCGIGQRRATDFEGNSPHQTDCPYYHEPLSNNPEWAADLALRKRRLVDPEFAECERREHLERSKIDGKTFHIHLDGDEVTVWVDGEIVDLDQLAQWWGDCKCGDLLAPPMGSFGGPLGRGVLAHPPSSRHRTDCPRYRVPG